ncbi:hypothetical protein CDAR_298091 [Caerostris darwini]|uniref:Uncharacterized protein n=1 Tax=Caerostris darwini TaxID=1538125 RepID=A0AAV4Q3J2_9ARAC|nr:hypothetical protein CDAR_298091 [Caerostris darwini]
MNAYTSDIIIFASTSANYHFYKNNNFASHLWYTNHFEHFAFFFSTNINLGNNDKWLSTCQAVCINSCLCRAVAVNHSPKSTRRPCPRSKRSHVVSMLFCLLACMENRD